MRMAASSSLTLSRKLLDGSLVEPLGGEVVTGVAAHASSVGGFDVHHHVEEGKRVSVTMPYRKGSLVSRFRM